MAAPQMTLLDPELLRTLVAIVETGNFSAAANEVHRTPSAISMQVKKLEDQVGRALFSRDSRSVSLTDDGELLLEYARRLLHLNREVLAKLQAPALAGTVRLGAPDDFVERALPELMRRFAESYCCITVDVVVDTSLNLAKAVRKGDLDLALVSHQPEKSLPDDFEIVFREPLVWGGARNGIAHEQLPMPVSVWDENCAWRSAGLNSLEKVDREYRIAFKSAHISGQRAAVKADLAIAPIPLSSCTDGIIALGPEQGLPTLPDYEVAVVVRKSPSEPVRAALDYLRSSLNEKLAA
ncbi:MAG: LysR family transcriptional regulator [Granulosicoccus sp.]|nr:LysR family transcriptional regulator [Granulosicoccus sp.]